MPPINRLVATDERVPGGPDCIVMIEPFFLGAIYRVSSNHTTPNGKTNTHVEGNAVRLSAITVVTKTDFVGAFVKGLRFVYNDARL